MPLKVDCLGDMCPIPILKARKALQNISKGKSILLVTDHSCVAHSLVETLAKKNYRINEEEVMNGVWEITVTKT